jgi:hypothetical protein
VGAAESRHVSEAVDLPAIVFAPARPDIRPEHRHGMVFEVRRPSHGGLARPAFSSLGRLTTALL